MLEVGFPNRKVVYTESQFQDFINKYNSKKNIYRSVYSFSAFFRGKPDYNTSIINQVYFDFDENTHETVKEFALQLKLDNIKFRVNFSGRRGFHFYIKCNHKNIDRKSYLTALHKHLIEKYNLTNFDTHVIGNIKQLRRIENSVHIETKLYCIPLRYYDLFLSFEQIKELAKTPRDFKYHWIGENKIKLDNINIDNTINENYIEHSNGEFSELENILPEPCIARILHLRHPSHEERFLLCLWISDKFRNHKDIRDFNLKELIEKIIAFMRGLNWDDYSEAIGTTKSTRYQVQNIIMKKYNFVPNRAWRNLYGICIYDCENCR